MILLKTWIKPGKRIIKIKNAVNTWALSIHWSTYFDTCVCLSYVTLLMKYWQSQKIVYNHNLLIYIILMKQLNC